MSLPTNYTLNVGGTGSPIDVGIGLPQIDIDIVSLPKINIGLDPIEIKPVTLDLHVSIEKIPSIRMHFPVDYKVCVGLLGSEILSVHLCGQGQLITEPYVPNPCECRYLELKPDTGTTASS